MHDVNLFVNVIFIKKVRSTVGEMYVKVFTGGKLFPLLRIYIGVSLKKKE